MLNSGNALTKSAVAAILVLSSPITADRVRDGIGERGREGGGFITFGLQESLVQLIGEQRLRHLSNPQLQDTSNTMRICSRGVERLQSLVRPGLEVLHFRHHAAHSEYTLYLFGCFCVCVVVSNS